MKEPKITDIKKYLSALQKINKKYVTAERLSRVVGIYPEIISDHLSYFDMTLPMDPSFNLMELVPDMKQFIIEKEENKGPLPIKKPSIKKKDVEQYESIYDFIYKKMTFAGGLLDKNVNLSDVDLKILKKLITEEQQRRKK